MTKKKKNKEQKDQKEKKLLKQDKKEKSGKTSKKEKPEKSQKIRNTEKTVPEEIQPVPAEKAAEKDLRTIPEQNITSGEAAEIFRALGDENRIRILELLQGGELCVADLLKSVHIVQSTLSHHLKILTEAGVIHCRKQGKWSYYSINSEMLKQIVIYVEKMEQKSWEK